MYLSFLILLCLACFSRARTWLVFLVLSSFGLVAVIYALLGKLSGGGINDAVVYHLLADMAGAGVGDFSRQLLVASACLFLVVLLSLLPLMISRWRVPVKAVLPGWIVYVAAMVLLVVSPLGLDIYRLHQQTQPVDDAGIAQEYSLPKSQHANNRNVVIIYLESLERTYLDQARFPGLLPNIERLRGEGLDFSDVRSLVGSGWTIGGLVRSQCGMPLTALSSHGDGNKLGRVQQFLPAATCFGDVLAASGYRLDFIGGAQGEFAGKGSFLAGHGFSTVRDKEYFQSQGVASNRFSGWGVHDDVLLDSVLDRYGELTQAGSPFVLAALTLDTHSPSGHMPLACQGLNYDRKEGDSLLDALHCSDLLVGRFVERLKKQPGWENTLLVLASDHVSLPNDLDDKLGESEERRNLLLMLNSGEPARSVDVPGATVDTGATILGLLGFEGKLGFGRSLLGERVDGMARAVSEGLDLRAYVQYAKRMWRLGSLAGDISIEGNLVHAGSQGYTLPVALMLDEQWNVVSFDPGGTRYSPAVGEVPSDGVLLYIDRCLSFGRSKDGADWCLWYRIAGESPKLIDSSHLKAVLKRQQLDAVSGVAPFGENFFRSFLIREHFNPDQLTLVGKVANGRLESQERAGTLMYGPYREVCPGAYRYQLYGHVTDGDGANVDVASNLGRYVAVRGDLPRFPVAGIIFDRELVFDGPTGEVEVRASVADHSIVALDGYRLLPAYPLLRSGQQLEFNSGDSVGRYLGCGWESPESMSRWSVGEVASLRGTLAERVNENGWVLSIDARAYLPSSKGSKLVELWVDEHKVSVFQLGPEYEEHSIAIPAEVLKGGQAFDIRFIVKDHSPPCKLERSADCRPLGLSVRTMKLEGA